MKTKYVLLKDVRIPISGYKDQCNPSSRTPYGYEDIPKGTSFKAVVKKVDLHDELFLDEEIEEYPGVHIHFTDSKSGILTFSRFGKMITLGIIQQIID